MNYILVENREIVHLGPISWRPRFIQSELDDLEVDFIINPTETGYVKINDNFEIIPITIDSTPPYDLQYQHLSGPFWNYSDQEVEMYYTVHDLDLESVKNIFKQQVPPIRYRQEIAGTKININGMDLSLDTSREQRNIYIQQYMSMGDNDTVNWKFPEAWMTLSKQQMFDVVTAVNNWIQTQFQWEIWALSQIDACQTVEEVKDLIQNKDPGVIGA